MQDIIELYKDAMDILTDPARTFSDLANGLLSGYLSAMCDEMRERWAPKVATLQDYADTLSEIWERPVAIVEDEQMRRRFCLLCQKVIEVDEMVW